MRFKFTLLTCTIILVTFFISCGSDSNINNPPPNLPQGILILGANIHLKEYDIRSGSQVSLHNEGNDPTYRNGLYVFWSTQGNNNSYALWKKDNEGIRHWIDIPVGIGANPYPDQPRISYNGDYVSYDALCYHPLTNQYGQYILVYETSNPGNIQDVVRVIQDGMRAAWLPPDASAPVGRLIFIGYNDNKIYLTDGQLYNPTEIPWNYTQDPTPIRAEPNPSGNRLAVVTTSGSLYVADLNISNFSLSNISLIRQATTPHRVISPVWSPDGRWIAYYWGATNNTEYIWISDITGVVPHIDLGIYNPTYSQIAWR